MNARDSLLRYLLCACSSIGEKYAILTPRKKGRLFELHNSLRRVCIMMAHTAQESSTITHPAPLAGIPQ